MQRRATKAVRHRSAALAAVTAILLGACGSSSTPSAPTPSTATLLVPAGGAPSPASPAPGAPTSGSLVAPRQAAGDPIAGRFPGGLLIADRGNGRLLVVSSTGTTLWRFPTIGSLPAGQGFAADDAFLAPDGRSIVANDEGHHVIDRIDVVTRRIVWQYGHYGTPGRGAGYLNTPDDAYPLANGDVVVADIRNCRVIEIAPSKQIVRQWGRTGVCVASAPNAYGSPNGDTPLPDGGLLITEIRGSRVVRLSASGKVVFDIHVPVAYPSDAHLDANGNVVVADYSTVGAVVAVTPHGKLVWRYAPRTGNGRLDHPSLAVPMPDGTVVVNDDFRARVVVIDPSSMRIDWQYGRTGVPGSGPNRLSDPDGVDPLPASGLAAASIGASVGFVAPSPGPPGTVEAAQGGLAIGLSSLRLPTPTTRAVAFPAGAGMVVVGGLTGSGTIGSVVRIPIDGGPPAKIGSLAHPVHDAGGALLDGSMLVIGGGASTQGEWVQRVGTDGRTAIIGRLPLARADLAAVSAGSEVVVVGGGAAGRADRRVLATRDGSQFRVVAELPVGVRYAAVVEVGTRILVIGGTASGGDTNLIQSIDLARGTAAVVGRLPHPLSHATALEVGGVVVVAGGRRAGRALDGVLVISPTSLAVRAAGHLPSPVSDAAGVVVDGVGYLVGGEAARPLATIVTIAAA